MLTEEKKLTFKKNHPFRSCMSKINNILIENAEDLDIFMSMYDLIECSDNLSMTSETCGIIIEMK